jgi:glycerol kinase
MPSPSPALVVLDQGTSVTRASLYRDGRLAATARRNVALLFPAAGRAEQDPRELLDSSIAVLEETCAHLADGEPAALGITNQRSTVVLWDADGGKPLGPALSWRDSRAQDEADRMAAAVPDITRRTGLPPSPHYGAPKIAWSLAHQPDVAAAAGRGALRTGPVSTWLAYRLSRGESFTVDPTNAQRMSLMDLHTLEWDPMLVSAARIPLAALPRILPTDGYFGEAHVGGRRLPLRAMVGDQQAALMGLTNEEREDRDAVAIQLGTGGFVLRDVGGEARRVPGLLAGLARAGTNRPRRYLVEGTVNSVGSAFDRLRDLGLLREGEDIDELCAGAAQPVTVVPAWAGLGSPWWEARTRAAIMGWDESTSRADIVAGTVHGIAFLVADILDAMRGAGLSAQRLHLGGPVSQVDALVQAICDATGLPGRVRTNPEASLEGLAVALADACEGVPPKLSLEHGRTFEPRGGLKAARAAFAAARGAAVRLVGA